MNIRYGKAFHIPRKIAKYTLSEFYPLVIKLFSLPKVKSIDDTLDKIIQDNVSICRFGDSEFLYIIDKIDLPYQRQIPDLRSKMIEILNSNQTDILVGLPIGYYSLDNLKKDAKLTWRSQISWIYPRLKKYLPEGKVFYNASMTRLYIDYEDTSKSAGYFEKVMKIWEGRSVVLLEGDKSRLGVGNDLFAKTIKVERILAPAHNAYDKVNELMEEALKQPKDKLILIAMGPTAKVLAFELALIGYQAIDIGNVDVEYEWYLRGATSKTKIPGKYTSEAAGGRIVEVSTDEAYNAQIIKNFA
jgi:glycosyltransferase family protein